MAGMEAIPTGTPGVSNVGLVKVRSVGALEAEASNKTAGEQQRVVDNLTGHLSKLLQYAKRAKEPIERQMLKNMRQVYGEYEPEKLAAIRQIGGSEVYCLLTMTKYRAALAWINDILRPVGDRPWVIKPTPKSELPPNIEGRIKSEGDQLYAMVVQNLAALGMISDPQYVEEEIQKYEQEIRDNTSKEIQKEAKCRAERMAAHIDDQLVEGGWDAAFWSVISDLVMLKAGILKGPVVRRRPVHTWVEKDGDWIIDVQDQLVPEYDRVSPFDWYPLSGATSIKDGGFERHHLTRGDLVAMIGVPGYKEANIRAALSTYSSGRREFLPLDTQLAQLRDGQTQSLYDSDRIETWEFWGAVQGRLLQQWGIPVADTDLEYEVNAWMVGEHTIRLILNPDKLGRKPYAVDSFERVPGAFWGKGLPELMADVQDVCNATARAIVNNAGLSSGPQVEVDKSRCGDKEQIYPWKIWPSTNAQMSEAPAIRFTQPTIVVGPLLQVFQAFSVMADDQTGVPKWAHGGATGGENTASGLSMRMTYAARGIKEVIAHIDTIIADAVGRSYDYNMLYNPDKMAKGDARIVASGSSALMAKEQQLLRTNEFLNNTNNPADLQIMQLKGRAKLLRTAAKLLDIDTDGIIPDSDSELEQLQMLIDQKEMLAAQASPKGGSQPGSGKAPAQKPQTTDAAGAPAGGTATNAFQNEEGVMP